MNVYEIVTARIVRSLEEGVVPWRCPWTTAVPKSLVSGQDYRGVNVLLLQSCGYASPYWLTYKQCQDRGGIVKRGEKGCPVIFWRIYGDDSSVEATSERGFVLRHYTVFNLAQTEGIEGIEVSAVRSVDPIAACEGVVARYAGSPRIEHAGSRACYIPARDLVRMPARDSFISAPEYYSTLFHELVHSTGAAHRLARKGVADPSRYAGHEYAFEELLAECGSAFLAAHTGISTATIQNSAAYIGSWARKLRSEPRWIVEAAGQASKAADLILGRTAPVALERFVAEAGAR